MCLGRFDQPTVAIPRPAGLVGHTRRCCDTVDSLSTQTRIDVPRCIDPTTRGPSVPELGRFYRQQSFGKRCLRGALEAFTAAGDGDG